MAFVVRYHSGNLWFYLQMHGFGDYLPAPTYTMHQGDAFQCARLKDAEELRTWAQPQTDHTLEVGEI